MPSSARITFRTLAAPYRIAALPCLFLVVFLSTSLAGDIFGTGSGVGPGERDTNWSVVAVPTSWTPPSGQSTPYNAYVYQQVDVNWIGSGG